MRHITRELGNVGIVAMGATTASHYNQEEGAHLAQI
jgi:hypothetical protein